MSYYESVFIARQDLTTAQVEALTATMAEIIGKNGGKVTKTEQWGLRNLAYRINKNRKGHYVLFNLDAPAAAVQEMERNLRLNEDVLRFLSVKVDELDPNPSAVLRRDERDEPQRGERGDRPMGGRRMDGSGRPARQSREETETGEI